MAHHHSGSASAILAKHGTHNRTTKALQRFEKQQQKDMRTIQAYKEQHAKAQEAERMIDVARNNTITDFAETANDTSFTGKAKPANENNIIPIKNNFSLMSYIRGFAANYLL